MPIQSLNRALDCLEYVARQKDPVSLRAISQESGLPETTVYNLIRVLVKRKYVEHVGPRHGYRLGAKIRELFVRSTGHQEIVDLARPRLEALRHELGNESCYLACVVDNTIIPILQVISTQALACGPLSETRELHATSLGKVVLASMTAKELRHWLSEHGLPAITPRTITDPGELARELARVRAQGYGAHFEENAPGIVAIAVAIQTSRFPLLGLYCALPAVRYNPLNLDNYVANLKRAGADLAAALNAAGGQDSWPPSEGGV